MRTIGLTGGIATGKSTVANTLRELGVPVIDADQVARKIVEPGEVLNAIVDAFGPKILLKNGGLHRAALRERITSDEAAKATLNAITHPAIFDEIAKTLKELQQAGEPVAVVEAALMVETGSYRLYEALIVVTTQPTTQLQRVIKRDQVSEEQARAIIATQLPLSEKEALATYLIKNNGSVADLKQQTEQMWKKLQNRAH